jgi:putative Mn2+ efflux pump MntP
MKADVLQTLKLCVNSLLAGVACGIMRFNLLSVILTVFAATAVCSVIGYISGRVYGGEQSSRIADAVGGGLLCAVGVLLQIL